MVNVLWEHQKEKKTPNHKSTLSMKYCKGEKKIFVMDYISSKLNVCWFL